MDGRVLKERLAPAGHGDAVRLALHRRNSRQSSPFCDDGDSLAGSGSSSVRAAAADVDATPVNRTFSSPSTGIPASATMVPATEATKRTPITDVEQPAAFLEYQLREHAEFLATKLAAANEDNGILHDQLEASKKVRVLLTRNLSSERQRNNGLALTLHRESQLNRDLELDIGELSKREADLDLQITNMVESATANHNTRVEYQSFDGATSSDGGGIPAAMAERDDGQSTEVRRLQAATEDLASQLTEIKGMFESSNEKKKRKRSTSEKKKKKRSRSNQSYAVTDGCAVM